MTLRTIALIGIAALAVADVADAQVIVRSQRQPQSWLGFSYRNQITVRNDVRSDVTVVLEVAEDSPADRAGLLAGDTLVSVNDLEAIESVLSSLRYSVAPGSQVRLRVSRTGGERVLTLTAAERPADMNVFEPDSRVIMIDPQELRDRVSILLDTARLRFDDARFPEIIVRGRGGDNDVRIFGDTVIRFDRELMLKLQDSLFMRLDSLHRIMPFGELRFDTIFRFGGDSAIARIFRSDGNDFVFRGGGPNVVWSGGNGIAMFGNRGIAGAQLAELEPGLAEYFDVDDGILVMRVAENTPAYRAGLRTGDVIVSADGADIDSIVELRRIISRGERTQAVRLDVIRKGARRTIQLARD